MSVLINEETYQATLAKVERINQRAEKRGFTGLIELVAKQVAIETIDEFGFERTEYWIEAELTGDPPCYNGWTFLATLDWDQHAGLVVRAAPGTPEVNRELLTENTCAHCGTIRNRNETYLVRNVETGEQVQVGSSCIKDFLGWAGSIVFLDMESVGNELPWGMGSDLPDFMGTQYAVAVAWALIKLDGYRPAKQYGCTKEATIDVLWPPRNMTNERRVELARIRDLADEAMERADECIAWVLSEDFEGASDYVRNLKAIAGAKSVSMRNIGLLASAPQAWAKWQQQSLIRKAETTTSEWIGEVGQKVTVTATIQAIRFIEGNFGTTVLYSMCDVAGNIIKWFASREALGDKINETVTIKATIKELDTFQNIKQTVITRAKLVHIVEV
jgi:hypothetical protein